ncbi:uncharacterized protein LOC131668682 [Phymastichus coffea]|uniref:uncharacterized protein LOC131668682 n=1 Tax=Phymastichus coffea TaxID=108790 RepID=UPI00273CD2E9|nr:uncharacterized protein LOC131668682 [Phymastichus coffea]
MLRDEGQLVVLREENELLQRKIEQLRQQMVLQEPPPQQQQLQEQQQLQPQGVIADTVNQRHAIHRVAVKLPPFWSDKPSLWFVQADSQFTLSDITNEVTKFHYVVSQLDARIALEVEDVIKNPPQLNPYTYLRTKIIERLSASEEQRVRQLISAEELGDRKPSQFLRHLQSFAGTTIVPDNLLRRLWLQRLPQNVQAIIAPQSELAIDKLSELADKIIEVSPCPPNFSVNAALNNKGTENDLLKAVAELQKQVAELAASRSRSRNRHGYHHNSRNRIKSQNRDDSSNKKTDEVCWYHKKCQQNAKKCVKPCKFLGNDQNGPNGRSWQWITHCTIENA